MAKGVKKVKWSGGLAYAQKSIPNKKLVIAPDQWAFFAIGEWEAGITDADKKKDVTWMWMDMQRKKMILQKTLPSTNQYGIHLPKNLCGPYAYFVEASTTGKPYINDSKGLYVSGYCPEKIVSSSWSTRENGHDVRKSFIFSYGHIIFLSLTTEGLNGSKVIVEVYRMVSGGGGTSDDQLVSVFTNVNVTDGVIGVKIGNSSLWYSKIKNPKPTEQFYVKVKNANGQYVSDGKSIIHARFLRIKKDLVSKAVEPSQNTTPSKVGKPNANAERYEPCKFSSITVTEPAQPPVIIFDRGKKLTHKSNPEQKIFRSVIFEFNKDTLTSESQSDLNTILQFLLEHQFSTIELSGYACVIGPKEYNLSLSKRRADVVKKFLTDGKLDGKRIFSTGYGEIQVRNKDKNDFILATDDDKKKGDQIKYRDEENYHLARRVDLKFSAFGHDADPVVYEMIAASKGREINIIVEAVDFDTNKCVLDKLNKHKKIISVKSPDAKIQNGSSKLTIPIHSTLSSINPAPIQYIWPKYNLIDGITGHGIDSAAIYAGNVHSCRYYSKPNHASFLIKAYPDIEWTLEFSFNFSNSMAYTHGNLPEYNRNNPKDDKVKKIIREERKAQSKAVSAGIETARMKNSPEMLTKFGLKLAAKWNNSQSNAEAGTEFAEKLRKVLHEFVRYKEIADKVKNVLGGAVKKSPIKPPFMFEVLSPSLNACISWSLEKGKNEHAGNVGVLGKLNFKGDPLLGAEFTIDLLAVGSRMHPAVAAMIAGTELALSALNGGIIFEATFYGKLEFDFNACEFSRFTGFKSGTFDMGAKLGLKIIFKVSFSVKYKTWLFKVEVKLRAEGKADAYFAGKLKFDSDDRGLFYTPELGFSGLIFTFEAEIVVGGFKRMLKFGNEDSPFLKADVPPMSKKYIT